MNTYFFIAPSTRTQTIGFIFAKISILPMCKGQTCSETLRNEEALHFVG